MTNAGLEWMKPTNPAFPELHPSISKSCRFCRNIGRWRIQYVASMCGRVAKEQEDKPSTTSRARAHPQRLPFARGRHVAQIRPFYPQPPHPRPYSAAWPCTLYTLLAPLISLDHCVFLPQIVHQGWIVR